MLSIAILDQSARSGTDLNIRSSSAGYVPRYDWRTAPCKHTLDKKRVAMFCCNVVAKFQWFQANASKCPTLLKPLWLLGFVYLSERGRTQAKTVGWNYALSN
jgi:hypothetical protein